MRDGALAEAGNETNVADGPVQFSRALAEYCSRCKGRINLMVNIKGVDDLWLEPYTRQIEEALQQHGLLENALSHH
jgi:hypothetical protein